MPFQSGHPKIGGRVTGTPNKTTVAAKQWAQELLDDPEWRASARARILAGKATHLESHILACLMPKTDRHEVKDVTWADVLQMSYEEPDKVEDE